MADYNVSIADLRTRITFQSPTVTTNAGGAQKPSFANVGTNPTVWAHWVYDHGDEMVQSNAAQVAQRATVTVRYRSDVLSTWQVVQVQDSSTWKLISPPENVQNLRRWTVFRVERVKGTL